jgi:hypothetical protein
MAFVPFSIYPSTTVELVLFVTSAIVLRRRAQGETHREVGGEKLVDAQFSFELVGGFSCGVVRQVNMPAMYPRRRPEGDPPPVYGNTLNGP